LVAGEEVGNFLKHTIDASFIKSCQTGLDQIWQLEGIIA